MFPYSSTKRSKAVKDWGNTLLKNTGAYGKEFYNEFRHPIKNFKRQAQMMRHKVVYKNGKPMLYRRSPLGSVATTAGYWGLPAYFGYKELKNKKPSAENEVRGITSILSAVTPKGLASYGIYSIPDLIKWKKHDKNIKLRR